MWTSPAPTAAAAGTGRPPRGSPVPVRTAANFRSRRSWSFPWTRRSTRASVSNAFRRACKRCTTWASAISPSARPRPRSRAARPSGSSSQARWGARRTTRSSCSTSPRSACTRSTLKPCSPCSTAWWRRGPRCSSSSTTSTSSATPITSSTWDRAVASAAAGSWRPAGLTR